MTPRLHRPDTLDEACSLLAELDDAMVYGGGTAIQILAKQGVLFAEDWVTLAGIPGLNEIGFDGACVRAGPMVAVRRMETDQRVRDAVPLVAAAYREIANPRVRNTASVGGNIAHGDYRLDPPPALLVLGATIEATSVRGQRDIPAGEYFLDFQTTALERDELVTAVRIPQQQAGSSGRFVKYSSLSANDWPCASAAVLISGAADGREVRVGIGALSPVPRVFSFDATGMTRETAVRAAVEHLDPLLDPIPDVRGSVEYKRVLGRVAVGDALRSAWKDLPDV